METRRLKQRRFIKYMPKTARRHLGGAVFLPIYRSAPGFPESERLEGFRFACFAAGKQMVAEAEPTALRPGWNLVSLTVADARRSFLVYGGKPPASTKGYGKKRGK
jgi:hypothetical protein